MRERFLAAGKLEGGETAKMGLKRKGPANASQGFSGSVESCEVWARHAGRFWQSHLWSNESLETRGKPDTVSISCCRQHLYAGKPGLTSNQFTGKVAYYPLKYVKWLMHDSFHPDLLFNIPQLNEFPCSLSFILDTILSRHFCLGKSVKFASFLGDSTRNNGLEIGPCTVRVWNGISDEGIINDGGS